LPDGRNFGDKGQEEPGIETENLSSAHTALNIIAARAMNKREIQ